MSAKGISHCHCSALKPSNKPSCARCEAIEKQYLTKYNKKAGVPSQDRHGGNKEKNWNLCLAKEPPIVGIGDSLIELEKKLAAL